MANDRGNLPAGSDGALCRAAEHKVGRHLLFFQPFTHVGGIAQAPLVEGTVDITYFKVVPTGFGVADEIKVFHVFLQIPNRQS